MSETPSQVPDERRSGWRLLSELELLISGAVIFTLFRIPGWLQAIFLHLDNQVGDDLFMVPFLLYYFANLLALALIVAFSVHFVLRAFWVAIAGLNQVFPQGIDWSKLDLSPIARKVARSFGSTAELERKLDRSASTSVRAIFATE